MEIRFAQKTLPLTDPVVMGILNVTPDSFYKESRAAGTGILVRAGKMLDEGASILDIGGCSTRPGATPVSEEEELARILPAIRSVRKQFPGSILSVDTFRSNAARQAVEAGADMINDISGGTFDGHMLDTAAALKVPYVLMHVKGTIDTMHQAEEGTGILEQVMNYFMHRINLALSKGIQQVILDPGFGFSKTLAQNYELLNSLSSFKKFGFPILAGISRKSMINNVLGTTAEEALNGTTVLNTMALMNGAVILRVHDVKEAMEAVKIFNFGRLNK